MSILKTVFENDIRVDSQNYRYEHYRIQNLIKGFKSQILKNVNVNLSRIFYLIIISYFL